MRSDIRTALAVLATAAVLMGSATMALAADADPAEPDPTPTATTSAASPTSSSPTPAPTPDETDPTPEPTATTPTPDVPTGAFTVTDAQMRWGVNDESNNKAFAPGTFNFFSAGQIPDPGRGGVAMPQSGWSQRSGNVSIEKYLNGAWTPATWAGLKKTSSGADITGTGGPFSNHEIVISGGTGTVDPAKGVAEIQWRGSFTVVYYSGYSFFYVTDPRLTVTNGVGRLTGTLSGYGSSMDDLEKWEAVPARPGVVLAELGRVDLGQQLGFSTTPAYRGVTVSVSGDASPQVRSGDSWGSFPQSFVDYQTSSGAGAYWYSSGGAADAHKVAKPVTVSYSAGAPVRVAPPKSTSSKTKKVQNDAPDAPGGSAPAASSPGVSRSPSAVAAPGGGNVPQAVAVTTQVRPVSTVTGVRPADRPADHEALWVLGGILLAATVLVALSPFAYSGVRTAQQRPLLPPPAPDPDAHSER
ncbi:hypothetical protein AERO_07175 [Aeromicrobium fastidiosum]|uniref:hypothetical protein n=1 Tax=Aeromicrobium fastidiosum TaxID=52699 RepID=UPI0020232C78|nr:hypothetical protein [Aeromicrobium fastidiosum]MCL8251161.1 hypothetical protein [Aeromicrobium fastidiosum]